MSNVNVNYSISNLPQVDRHVNDTLKTPLVTHDQNTQNAVNETARKLMMPVEVTQSEQQITDPDERKNDRANKRKKRLQTKSDAKDSDMKKKRQDHGFFVDVEG